jgi:hypothetical protein
VLTVNQRGERPRAGLDRDVLQPSGLVFRALASLLVSCGGESCPRVHRFFLQNFFAFCEDVATNQAAAAKRLG